MSDWDDDLYSPQYYDDCLPCQDFISQEELDEYPAQEWADKDVDEFYEEYRARQRYDAGFEIG
jgi:hypothetical protein